MMNSEINLQIDSLILDGVTLRPGEERLLQAALQSELVRLLADNGLNQIWSSGAVLPELRAAPIQSSPHSDPAGFGRQIAHSVYGSLKGTPHG
jgi:hypothetical protein